MKVDNPARELAQFAVGLKWEDLPPAVVHETKRILMDSIGCAIGALTIDKGKMSLSLARKLGGKPEATIFGTGDKASLMTAALANGELMFTLDYHNIMSNAHDGLHSAHGAGLPRVQGIRKRINRFSPGCEIFQVSYGSRAACRWVIEPGPLQALPD
jgi:2-methylcitrate dehydratase PrpD